MQTNTAIARCFNKAANTYDQHAHIQRRACRLLVQMTKSFIIPTGTMIDIGCGTGLSTQTLLQHYPSNALSAIDISSGLLHVAQQRLKNTKVPIKQSDFDDCNSYHNQYTLMFSNMALQWSPSLTATLGLLNNHLQADGVLAFSVPLQNTFKQFTLTRHQHLLTHEDVCYFLNQAGLQLMSSQIQSWHETHKNALAAMKSIKAIGANHTNSTTPSHNFSFVRQTIEHNDEKPFNLTHEIGFYIAGKTC